MLMKGAAEKRGGGEGEAFFWDGCLVAGDTFVSTGSYRMNGGKWLP